MIRRPHRLRWALVGALLAAMLVAPFWIKPSSLYLLSLWAVTTIAVHGLNLTLGYAGQISMAQGAFVGVGAYTVAILAPLGWPYPAAFLAGGVICFVFGWLLGYPALRVQHHYLAFVTLAFSTLMFLVFRNEQWLTNGVYGITGIARPTLFGWSTAKAVDFYFFSLLMLAIFSAAMWWMMRSPWGRAFKVLRENPTRALSLGVDTRRYTLLAFAIGSALGGFAGALYAPLVQFIEPGSFSLGYSMNLLLMVIVGGSGFLAGPFLGTLVAIILPDIFRFSEGYYLIFYALAVMLLMAFCPKGLLGLPARLGASGQRISRGAGAPQDAVS